ncbi:alpha/beta fold hydrolase [Phenylobacterium aquaticum]|uniref:alpha/beta fold hydrolase n=1 Tax=Phenylobacterium aquaticum TaxID=1763816 RepID=UPI001F5DADFF|nr:alpha/beta hydrolase [Phenylobacterium aquaticum]MCI3134223.1 alpha/beta fold hydrolase [Phenylobacterium aquaticum]
MTEHHFTASDGVRIAYAVEGAGRPVILLHGFLSSGARNWAAPRLVQALVETGRQVIVPDARGHGRSEAPTDPALWPADVMARDVIELVAHLGLTDYDLAGYSMGGRTAIRAIVGGLRPRRLVIGGMGETAIMEAGPRADAFEDAIRNGALAQDAAMGAALHKLMADQGLKPEAMLGVLASFHPTTEAEIRAIGIPALVLMGRGDHDNGSGETLAAWLGGRFVAVRGDHGTAVAAPEFRETLVDFLA